MGIFESLGNANKGIWQKTTGLIPNMQGKNDYSDAINARGQSPYDEATDNLIGQQYHLASQTAPDIAAAYTTNLDKSSAPLASAESVDRKNASLGMLPNPALTAAIQHQAQQGYRNDLNNINQRELLAAPARKFDRMQMSIKQLGDRQALMDKAQQGRVELALQQREARASAISSVFAGVGTIVGSIYGGPVGAKAGGAVGGQAGGMAAGGV